MSGLPIDCTSVSDYPRLAAFAASLSEAERVAFGTMLPRSFAANLYVEHGISLSKFDRALSASEKLTASKVHLREKGLFNTRPYPYGSLFVIMKSTRLCNLRCVYCSAWRSGPNQKMSFDILASATIGSLQDPSVKSVDFVWHGGEATLLGIEFYQKALWLQDNYNTLGKSVTNSLQTNAYQLTPEWADFLKRHDFSVGVSVDGPPELHDSKRITIRHKPTYQQVSENIALLTSVGIKVGVLLVAGTEIISLGPRRLLEWLETLDVEELAILNSLPDNRSLNEHNNDLKHYLPFDSYVEFLVELYEEWTRRGQVLRIREFESLANNMRGRPSVLCVHNGRCMGQFLTIDPDGAVSACDKYVNDNEFVFGTLEDQSFYDLTRGSKRLTRQRTHSDNVSKAYEQSCPYGSICRGGCPHDAYVSARTKRETGICCGLSPLIETMLRTEQGEVSHSKEETHGKRN